MKTTEAPRQFQTTVFWEVAAPNATLKNVRQAFGIRTAPFDWRRDVDMVMRAAGEAAGRLLSKGLNGHVKVYFGQDMTDDHPLFCAATVHVCYDAVASIVFTEEYRHHLRTYAPALRAARAGREGRQK